MNPLPLFPLAKTVVAWQTAHRLPLPWRENPTPYRVWISEIMLQQTRIEAVIPYFTRFMDALPTIADLAAVEETALLKLWEGLGYYSRARNLKKAAVVLMESFGGALPASADQLRTLPGIGDYTAGAIASMAFGLPEPAVDGNVLRVIMRLTGSADDILAAQTKKAVTAALRPLYGDSTGNSPGNNAMLTEGLMGLGQNICTPSSPQCTACPLAAACAAYRDGRAEELPHRAAKKPRRIEHLAVFLLERNGRYAIRRRGSDGLLAGLWEFPNCPADAMPPLPDNARVIGEEKHIFTHVEWHMTGYLVPLDDATALPSDFLPLTPEEIDSEYALPTAFAKWKPHL